MAHYYEFEMEDALVAAEIRASLMSRGQVIGLFDLLIAAQAVRRDLTVVTNNHREFRRVPGLRWEDWTQA